MGKETKLKLIEMLRDAVSFGFVKVEAAVLGELNLSSGNVDKPWLNDARLSAEMVYGNKILYIKRLREMASEANGHLGLKEAKEIADSHFTAYARL